MFLTKLKAAATFVLAAAVVGIGAGKLTVHSMAREGAGAELAAHRGLEFNDDPATPDREVNDLLKALKDDEPRVRIYAALTLLRLQTRARPAVPALILALQDDANQTNADAFHFTPPSVLLKTVSAGSLVLYCAE